MMSVPEALTAYKQFTIYKLVPRADGKTDKIPCDFRTGKACSWTDPAFWTNSDTAIRAAFNFGDKYGVGFVLTEADPFFLLDIDNCLIDGAWSQTALSMAALLPGVAIEISQSGQGWHLIGSGRPPPHGCRNDALGLEFYHSGRHIALTGSGLMGDAGIDFSEHLARIIPEYFPQIGKARLFAKQCRR
jgi:primase-polymerase (primpol)-like protein